MPGDFAQRYGPVAVVTGASSGIGWGFAEELAARRLDLVIVARREAKLADLASRLRAEHPVAVDCLALDLSDAGAAQAIIDYTQALDVGLVVSNAGFGFKGDHASLPAAELTDMLMVNAHVPMQLARGFAPRLRQRGKGGLIMTSSVEAMIGVPGSAAYSATKALVAAFGEALWAEWQADGIDALTVLPGATISEASAKQGIDPAKLEDVKTGREVARLTLDALGSGPTFHSSEHYKGKFEQLLAMPRQQALLAMQAAAQAMRGA